MNLKEKLIDFLDDYIEDHLNVSDIPQRLYCSDCYANTLFNSLESIEHDEDCYVGKAIDMMAELESSEGVEV